MKLFHRLFAIHIFPGTSAFRRWSMALVACSFGVTSSAQTFEEVAGIDLLPLASGFMGGGVVMADFNGDGMDDLYLTGCNRPDKLYINQGNMVFADLTAGAGLEVTALYNTIGAVSGDIDNDGDQDLFVYTWKEVETGSYAPNLLFINDGSGGFTESAASAGVDDAVFTMAAAMLDVNLDGFLDLYVGNYVENAGFILEDGVVVGFDHDCFEDVLYLNNQDLTFSDVTAVYGVGNDGCTLAVAATDYDSDGDTDLMVANDFGEFITPNKLYRNDFPEAHFTDVGPATGADRALYAMGIATGDYDEDLDLDYYITNLGYHPCLNHEEGVFEEVASDLGIECEGSDGLFYTGWGTAFFDADNDSYLDLAVAHGHMPTIDLLANHPFDANYLFRQDGSGGFEDVSQAAGVADTNIARGLATGDLDGDGRLELAIVNIENDLYVGLGEHFLLYHNTSPVQNHVSFDLEGTVANRDAIGAQVYLYAAGRVFMRELTGGGASHCSQHSKRIHFGLGTISAIDSVQVRWPGNYLQTLFQPAINEVHAMVEAPHTGVIEQSGANISISYLSGAHVLRIDLQGVSNPGTAVSLYDAAGKSILDRYLPGSAEHSFDVHLPILSPGLYVVKVETTDGLYTDTICVYNR